MNVLGCLDTPSKGRYLLNGKDVSVMVDDELAAIRNQEIGFIFQNFQLLRARRRSRTSSCRWSTGACARRSATPRRFRRSTR